MDFIKIMAYERGYMAGDDDHGPHIFLANDDHGRRARKAFEALIMGGNP